jgi:hypothetical protein
MIMEIISHGQQWNTITRFVFCCATCEPFWFATGSFWIMMCQQRLLFSLYNRVTSLFLLSWKLFFYKCNIMLGLSISPPPLHVFAGS